MKFEFKVTCRDNPEAGESTSNASSDLTKSDWFNFLSNQSTNALMSIMSLGALLITGLALIKATEIADNSSWVLLTFAGMIAIIAVCMFVYNAFLDQHRISSKILSEMIERKLNDPEEIRKRWLKDNRKRAQFRTAINILILGLFLIVVGLVIFAVDWSQSQDSDPTQGTPTHNIEQVEPEVLPTNMNQADDLTKP